MKVILEKVIAILNKNKKKLHSKYGKQIKAIIKKVRATSKEM